MHHWCARLVMLGLLACAPPRTVDAQPIKPLGTFGTLGAERPSWASFSLLLDWQDFHEAKRQSELTGVKWVIYINSTLYGPQSIESAVRDIVVKIALSGITPYLVGITYHEEWYEGWLSSQFTIPLLDAANPQHWRQGAETIKWWINQQHVFIKQYLPYLPIVWITTVMNNRWDNYGDFYYRPLPETVDIVALEMYVPCGATVELPQVILATAKQQTTKPLVLILQGFQTFDGLWKCGPQAEHLPVYRAMLNDPQIVAGWVFDWLNRTFMVGLKDLPIRGQFEQMMGVR